MTPAVRETLHRLRRDGVAAPALRIGLLLVSFYTAYRGVLLLEDQQHITRGVVYFAVAAVMLIVAGLGAAREVEEPETELEGEDGDEQAPAAGPVGRLPRSLRRWPATTWWVLLAAALGLGVAFRVYLLNSAPFGIWFDEAQNGIVARRILEDSSYRPVFVGELSQLPALFFYIFALAMRIFGETILTLRSVTAVAGIATVALVYLLARELFGHRVAVLATFFLAVMRWHVNFSRFAMHGIFAPLFMVATFYFLVRGLKGKGTWNFVAAGVMAGVGLQGYFSFLLAPFVVGLFLIHYLVFQRGLPWRTLGLGIGAFAVTAVVVYSPVGVWALRNQDEFAQRTETTSITKDRSTSEVVDVVYDSTKTHLLMFHSAGDRNGRHNLPGAPMLDTYTGFLFVLGAALALWRIRDPGHFLLLVWVVIMLQGGIWSVEFEAPQAYRTQGLTPAVAMLAALPLGLLWNVATAKRGREPPGAGWWRTRAPISFAIVAAVVTVLVLVQAGRLNFDRYFHDQLRDPAAWQHYSTDVTAVAKEIDRLGPEHEYRVSTLLAGQPTLQFVAPEVDTSQQLFDWVLDVPSRSDRSTVYFLDQTKGGFATWLGALYPDARLRTFAPPGVPGPVIVYEVIVDAEDVQALRGLDAIYTPAGGNPTGTRETALDLDWSAGAPGAFPIGALWSGYLEAPTYETYQITLNLPGSARIFLDDELIAEGSGLVTASTTLFKGEHELLVEATVEDPGRIVLSWNGEPINHEAYYSYSLAGHGLLGTFYRSEDLSGEPELVELDPLIAFRFHSEPQALGRPFSVVWRGLLDVPTSGAYILEMEAFDRGTVSVDGRFLLGSEGGGSVQEVELTEGAHDIEVTFVNVSGFANVALYWTTPDGVREVIPPQQLRPR